MVRVGVGRNSVGGAWRTRRLFAMGLPPANPVRAWLAYATTTRDPCSGPRTELRRTHVLVIHASSPLITTASVQLTRTPYARCHLLLSSRCASSPHVSPHLKPGLEPSPHHNGTTRARQQPDSHTVCQNYVLSTQPRRTGPVCGDARNHMTVYSDIVGPVRYSVGEIR